MVRLSACWAPPVMLHTQPGSSSTTGVSKHPDRKGRCRCGPWQRNGACMASHDRHTS